MFNYNYLDLNNMITIIQNGNLTFCFVLADSNPLLTYDLRTIRQCISGK